MLYFAVGSDSAVKVNAVLGVMSELLLDGYVGGYAVSSGQNAEPEGFEAILLGAINRAENLKPLVSTEHYRVGIENGVIRFPLYSLTLDLAVIVVITPKGQRYFSVSPAVVFPEEMVRQAEQAGFEQTTVGSVIAKALGGSPKDPHSILTGGRLTRAEILAMGVKAALVQIPELFSI